MCLAFSSRLSSTYEQLKTQVAHDTFGFKVSSIGGHERREDGWHLLPLWKGFESKENERVWQDLHDVFAGVPVLIKRSLRKLLKSKDPTEIQDGTDMCKELGLDPAGLAAAGRPEVGA